VEKTSGSAETRNDSVGNPSKSMLHGAGSIPILSFTAMKSAECSRDVALWSGSRHGHSSTRPYTQSGMGMVLT
jgi:hypothetical protein